MNRLYAALLVSAELLWTYAVLVALTEWGWLGWTRPPVTLGLAAALAATALAPALLTESSWRGAEWLRALALPVQAVVLAAAVRLADGGGYGLLDAAWFGAVLENPQAPLGAACYGGFLVWRSVNVAAALPVPERLHTRFLLGLTALFAALLLAFFADDAGDGRSPLLSLGIYAALYFVAGMTAIALATLRDMRREMARRSDGGTPSLREWMAIPLVTVGGMLGASLAFAALFSFDLARFLLLPLEYVARGVAYGILYGLIWPLSFVAGALTWVLGWLGGQVEQQDDAGGDGPLLDDTPLLLEQGEAALFSDAALLAMQWGAGVLAAALALWVLSRALGRFRRSSDADDEEETSESLGAWSGFAQDLRMFMSWLLSLMRRRPRRAAAFAMAPPAAAAASAGAARTHSIREIYQGVLWEGRAAGSPRRDAETPYEYGGRLRRLAAGEEAALDDITQAYVQARYGGGEPSGEGLQSLNAQWRRLRDALAHGDDTR